MALPDLADRPAADPTRELVIDAVAPADDTAHREWYALAVSAGAHDLPAGPPPCWVELRARLTAPEPGHTVRAWLARAGDAVVGAGVLALPELDNHETSLADVVVAPAHRRRGVGGLLLGKLAATARAAGRRRMILEAAAPLDGPDPGALFLGAAGAREAIAGTRRRLALPPPGRDLDRLAAQARTAAAGYALVQWSGATPTRWRDDVAALLARMSVDVPLGDLHYEPEQVDGRRVRDTDSARTAAGVHRVVTAATGPDGHLAAYTEIRRRASVAWHASQGDTIVAPAHRGHLLGTLVKLANLERLRAEHPDVRVVDTCNADANPWMVSINEAMGYRPLDRLGEWELDL